MYRTLTLLFLSFLCTCVLAQTEAISPIITTEEPLGSGTLIVLFGDGTWELSLSSGTRYEKFRYVTEANYRRRPAAFAGFTIVPGNDRYDLRMVHEMIDRLNREGWKLIASNHNQSQSANEWGTESKETIFYQFSVPTTVPKVSVVGAEKLFQVAVADRDQLRLRGALTRAEDGKTTLKMEESVHGKWLTYYTLVGEGILTGDVARRIKAISATERKLSFRIEMANGNYDYHFIRGGSNGYYFAGVHFMSNDDCGVVQYDLSLLQTVDAQLTGFYQPEPCPSDSKPRSLSGRYPVRRTWLKDFVPGSQRIEVEEAKAAVFY